MRQTGCLPMECLERTPISNYGAAVAVRVGMAELAREKGGLARNVAAVIVRL
jgi:hypothetical protein